MCLITSRITSVRSSKNAYMFTKRQTVSLSRFSPVKNACPVRKPVRSQKLRYRSHSIVAVALLTGLRDDEKQCGPQVSTRRRT